MTMRPPNQTISNFPSANKFEISLNTLQDESKSKRSLEKAGVDDSLKIEKNQRENLREIKTEREDEMALVNKIRTHKGEELKKRDSGESEEEFGGAGLGDTSTKNEGRLRSEGELMERRDINKNEEEIWTGSRIPYLNNMKVEPLENFDEHSLFENKKSKKFGAIRGFSRWREPDGEIRWRECFILDYEEGKVGEEDSQREGMYLIQWSHNRQFKKVKRLNLMLENESREEFEERCRLARKKREKALYFKDVRERIEGEVKLKKILMEEDQYNRIIQR
jgi:hypothetical protein